MWFPQYCLPFKINAIKNRAVKTLFNCIQIAVLIIYYNTLKTYCALVKYKLFKPVDSVGLRED